jgi:hypothetical protein
MLKLHSLFMTEWIMHKWFTQKVQTMNLKMKIPAPTHIHCSHLAPATQPLHDWVDNAQVVHAKGANNDSHNEDTCTHLYPLLSSRSSYTASCYLFMTEWIMHKWFMQKGGQIVTHLYPMLHLPRATQLLNDWVDNAQKNSVALDHRMAKAFIRFHNCDFQLIRLRSQSCFLASLIGQTGLQAHSSLQAQHKNSSWWALTQLYGIKGLVAKKADTYISTSDCLSLESDVHLVAISRQLHTYTLRDGILHIPLQPKKTQW